MIDISNLLTLRYDPTNVGIGPGIRNITQNEISECRLRTSLPSLKDLEKAIRRMIKIKIEESETTRIAMALSAGVDSNLIFSLIRKDFPNINIECITVGFGSDNSNEVKRAKEIAESHNAGFHEVHIENILKDLPMLLSIVNEPRWNVYQYYFIEKAKSLSNELFTGDGGDELFGGYIFRYKKFLERIKPDYSWRDRAFVYLQCHERDWVPDQEKMFGSKVKFSWSSIYHILKKYFDNNLDPLEQVLIADYHGKLMYDFVPTNEKFFRYFNIPGIAPLLCKEVIDLSVKIPASLKYDYVNNIGKIQLREIIRRNTTSFIDDNKRGFGTDLINFWFKWGREMVISNLEKGRIFEDKIINRDWYFKSLIRINERRDQRYISKMLHLLSLEIWYKLFVTSEMTARSTI